MILKRYVIPRFMTNCYIIGDEHTKQIAVVDPGDYNDRLIKDIDENGYQVQYIILTHGHFDHVMGVQELIDRYHPQVAMHADDQERIFEMNAIFKQLENNEFDKIPVHIKLQDGDALTIGNEEWKVLHTPGHSEGSICLYSNGVLLSGDTLFHQSVGRTDFKFGNTTKLITSVRKLYELPPQTTVYPGHGFRTTIGEEMSSNPIVRPL